MDVPCQCDYGVSPVVSYCVIDGGYGSGTNIITADPLLDATNHIQTGSSAIDTGADTGLTTDIDGDARTAGSYDIGADEYAAE